MQDLIYDVGAHLGEDSQHYLAKGFKVVAVEANPDLASHLRKRFAAEMADGRFKLVECVIAEQTGYQTFYVNETTSVWGTAYPQWAARNARLGSDSRVSRLPSRPFAEVMKEFGVPYYLKIDVEGADLLCLDGEQVILQILIPRGEAGNLLEPLAEVNQQKLVLGIRGFEELGHSFPGFLDLV